MSAPSKPVLLGAEIYSLYLAPASPCSFRAGAALRLPKSRGSRTGPMESPPWDSSPKPDATARTLCESWRGDSQSKPVN
jgi:hypothetical protein